MRNIVCNGCGRTLWGDSLVGSTSFVYINGVPMCHNCWWEGKTVEKTPTPRVYSNDSTGWECPKCRNIYSPYTSFCPECSVLSRLSKLSAGQLAKHFGWNLDTILEELKAEADKKTP